MTLSLYNTQSRQLEPFVPLQAPHVNLYVCGPTVYDDAHLGHARCYITWDVLYRFLTLSGYCVKYSRNVTDVDDKILNRARALSMPPKALADQNYQEFLADMARLNVLPPTDDPHASQHIEGMQTLIQGLLDKGFAYISPTDGTVYYSVPKNLAQGLGYGKLSGKPLDSLQAGARVEVDAGKQSPLDFALWKPELDLTQWGWPSPWGYGRPGWHIECSAMNLSVFEPNVTLDIHAGGADLVFPHHENEIAQSEAYTGHLFCKYWLHNGFVNVSGEKMSKSLGNFASVKTVLERYHPNTIRYFLLQHHYRMPVDFNDEALQGAENRVRKLHELFQALHITQQHATFSAEQVLETAWGQAFFEAMNNDLNTPQALAVLNGKGDTDSSYELTKIAWIWQALGFAFPEAQKSLPAQAHALLEQRVQAKQAKAWPQADALREQLKAMGVGVKDNSDGTSTGYWL